MEAVVFAFGFAKITRVLIGTSAHSSGIRRIGDGCHILEAVARSSVQAICRSSTFSTVCGHCTDERNDEEDPELHSSMFSFGHLLFWRKVMTLFPLCGCEEGTCEQSIVYCFREGLTKHIAIWHNSFLKLCTDQYHASRYSHCCDEHRGITISTVPLEILSSVYSAVTIVQHFHEQHLPCPVWSRVILVKPHNSITFLRPFSIYADLRVNFQRCCTFECSVGWCSPFCVLVAKLQRGGS